MPARRHLTVPLLVALVFSACATGPELDVKIDESAQGAVHLTRTSAGSLQAAHPINIDSSTIALVLNGILIRDTLSVQHSSRVSDTRRVFSRSEVGYLAPPIAEGLRRAASDQQVRFRVGQAAGTLYAYGRSLYVTLTEYHLAESSTTKTANNTVADKTGLATRTLSFVPESAKRPDTYLDAGSTGKTLVINYELLDRLPAAASVPSSAEPVPALPPPLSTNAEKADPVKEKADPVRKDAEIEALRKELQEIKQQLAEQQAERARSQSQKPLPR